MFIIWCGYIQHHIKFENILNNKFQDFKSHSSITKNHLISWNISHSCCLVEALLIVIRIIVRISHILVGFQYDLINDVNNSLGRCQICFNNVGTTKRDAT